MVVCVHRCLNKLVSPPISRMPGEGHDDNDNDDDCCGHFHKGGDYEGEVIACFNKLVSRAV